MKKQKIFFPFCGETMGGSHFSSLLLINQLKKKHKIFIGIHRHGLLKRYLEKKKISYHFLNKGFFSSSNSKIKNLLNIISNFYFFFKFIKSQKIDVIHINDYRMLNTWSLVSYVCNLKKIVFHQRSQKPISIFVDFNLNFVSNIISVSSFVNSTLNKSSKSKSTIITNPIAFVKNYNVKKSNIIGCVSNYQPRKRIDIFFQFANKLSFKEPKIKYVFIGNIDKKIINLVFLKYPNLANKLKFTQFLDNPFKILRNFKLLICPAENDGFGRIPLEAAFLGVPSILSYSGGHKEFKKYNLCLYVKKNTPSNYLALYKKAFNSKIKKKLINNALLYNKQFTDPIVHSMKVLEIYKSK